MFLMLSYSNIDLHCSFHERFPMSDGGCVLMSRVVGVSAGRGLFALHPQL